MKEDGEIYAMVWRLVSIVMASIKSEIIEKMTEEEEEQYAWITAENGLEECQWFAKMHGNIRSF